MNKRLVLLIPLVLAASLLVPSYVIPRAHAQFTGIVCITASPTATSCPTAAPALGPITAGQNFTVGVFIQGSDAMGGFDIYVQDDQTFLNPRAAALGPLIVTPSLTSICVNGASQTGACTVNTANGPGVVEVTTIDANGNECGGISPCSGMAFTITYTAVASTSSTPLSYPTAPGCAASSVASPPNVCVEVADSTGTILPETIQGATTQVVGLTLVSVVKGTDNNLYYNTFAGGWGGTWQALNGQTPSPPSLCASGGTTTELVIRGTDNGIYHKTFSGSTFSATWDRNPNGVTSMQPVCAVLGTTLYVVVVGPTGEIWSTTFDLSAHTWAAAWTDLSGATPSTPALAATPSVSRLDLVVRGTNNLIYHKALTSGAWATAWDTSNRSPVPDKTIGAPAIISDGSQLHVVVIGTEGNLWYATLSFAGVWSTYTSLVGSTPANPVLVIDSANTIRLVVTGSDGHVYEKAHPSGGSWEATWTSAGGIVSGTPAVTTIGTVVHVVVKGGDARLWYNTLSGSTWSGYVFMNGAASLAAGLSTP